MKNIEEKIFPRLSADECAACKKDERDMRTSVRWTERQKYGKILQRYGTKRENENFRNRSGIVYLESSFDMISIKQKKE